MTDWRRYLGWPGTGFQLGGCFLLALHAGHVPLAFAAMSLGAAMGLARAALQRDWAWAALMAGFEATNILGLVRWGLG